MVKKIALVSSAVAVLSADPLITYIGTKAKAMGGAFTALANNNSAMYFNPAGLVDFEETGGTNGHFMVSLEGGIGAKFDEQKEDVHSTTGAYFFGLSMYGKGGGAGFAYYTLYDLNLKDKNSDNYYKEEVSVMSLSGAFNLVDSLYPYGGKLTIGITGAYASSSSSSDENTLDVSGAFYAVGLKYRLINHRAFKIDLGCNYRSSATLDSDSESYENIVGVGIPEEMAAGVAISYGTTIGLITISADYRETGYEEITRESDFDIDIPDVSTTNLGIELAMPRFQLRMGAYESDYQYKDEMVDSSISGISAGFGYVTSSSLSVEVAVDRRTYTKWEKETTNTFASASVNFAF